MKRTISLILFLVLLCAGAVTLSAAENATVTGDGVRIRETPGTSGTVIGSVNKGTRLEVTLRTSATEMVGGHLDSWYEVTYQGKKGYVFGRFLTLDAGAAVPTGGTTPQAPTSGKNTVRPEDIIGDWALYGEIPRTLYTFEPEGFAQYLTFTWDAKFSGDRISRKFMVVDLVRGQYVIEGSTVHVRWYWGDKAESSFEVLKEKDGVTLVVDGQTIPPRSHAAKPGSTTIEDIIINTEPDL